MKWPSKMLQNWPLSTQRLGENTNIWYFNIQKMAISSSISEYLLFCTHKSATVVDRRCIFCNLCNLVKIKFCDNLSSPTSDTYSRSIFINQWKPHEGTNYKEHSGIFLLFLHTISYILYYYTSVIMVIVLDSSVSPILVSTKNT